MSSPKTAYENLKERFERMMDLGNAASILSGDMQVNMPRGSSNDRMRQLTALSSAVDEIIKSPEIARWLTEAEADKAALSADDQRNLALMRRQWTHQASLPKELVEQVTTLENEGNALHSELRKTGDWTKMKDWYQHSFDTMRAVGEVKKKQLGVASAYDALLDGFSPELSDAAVTREFTVLEKYMPKLISDALAVQKTKPEPLPLIGPFPREQQAVLFRRLAEAEGFNFNKGRMDVIDGHPMCGGTSSDVRFLVGCSEDNFIGEVYSVLHEAGHAIYNQNTPETWRYQPLGQDMGMSIHESQSRIMEVQACHTKEFFKFLEKEARLAFNRPDDPAFSAENLERTVNRVKPSFIRTQADEVTYSAHVILRHKLEKALIEGTLTIDDLPQKWNEGIKNMLGITPPDAAQGCMQDVHWPIGYIGYFPAYTLGDMGAAQFYAAAVKARPEIPAELEKGNFTPLRTWLNENVHNKGCKLTSEELFIAATGEPLNAKYYLEHLSQRYLGKPWVEPAAEIRPANPCAAKRTL